MTTPWREIRTKLNTTAGIYSPDVLLMVSGGVDSMFLLDFCSRCDFDFDVVHFNHNIRQDSLRDLDVINEAVAKINLEKLRADKRQIRTHYGQGQGLSDIPNQEAEAYKQRWEFVEQIVFRRRNAWTDEQPWDSMSGGHSGEEAFYHRNQCPTPLVITAHHLNDNIESALMDLMRGKEHNQLGMVEHKYFMYYSKFKPLLNVTKAEIIEQANNRSLKWNEDSTNTDNKNERNWLRNVIVPQLMERRNLETSMQGPLSKRH